MDGACPAGVPARLPRQHTATGWDVPVTRPCLGCGTVGLCSQCHSPPGLCLLSLPASQVVWKPPAGAGSPVRGCTPYPGPHISLQLAPCCSGCRWGHSSPLLEVWSGGHHPAAPCPLGQLLRWGEPHGSDPCSHSPVSDANCAAPFSFPFPTPCPGRRRAFELISTISPQATFGEKVALSQPAGMAIIPSPHLASPLTSLHPITLKCKGLCGAGRRLFLLSSCVNATISRPSDGGSDSPAGWRWLRHSRMIRGEPELVCSTSQPFCV